MEETGKTCSERTGKSGKREGKGKQIDICMYEKICETVILRDCNGRKSL